MEPAIFSPASLAPRVDAMLHPVDVDLDVARDAEPDAHFATNTSSHGDGDDDMKGSDDWRLASDASTASSSRVTTPDPQPHPPSARRIEPPSSPASVLPLPPPPRPHAIYHPSGLEHRPYPPKLPGSLNGAATQLPPPTSDLSQRNAHPARAQGPPRSKRPPPPQAPPLPPPSTQPNGGTLLQAGHVIPILPPPPPPPPPVRMPHNQKRNDSNMRQQSQFSTRRQHSQGRTGSVPDSSHGSARSRSRSRSKRKKQLSRRTWHARQHEASSESASSTYSPTQPLRATSWSSASSSEEDPVAYRNSRQFPPQFPAPPTCRPSAPRSRTLATSRITTWVSQYEKSRSPTRAHEGATALMPPEEEAGSLEDGSTLSDVSPYAEVEFLWQQLKEKRARLSDIKRQMAERRQQLRRLRSRKNEADNAFMSVVRPMLVSQRGFLQTSVQLLDSRMADIQDIQDDYHVRESDYEALELMMDNGEAELSRLETRFFSLLAAGQGRAEIASDSDQTSSEAESFSPSNVPYELRGISADKTCEDLHPLYVELTSAVGDLENAKEELDDLLYINKHYEFELELKKTTGKESSADLREFLDEFPAEEARMRAEVCKLEGDVQRLKKLCEEKKVMRKHMSVPMAYVLDPNTKLEDMELEDRDSILARKQTLAHPVFGEILSQPDHVLAKPEPLTSRQALGAAARLPAEDGEKREKERLAAKEFWIDSLMQGDEVGGRGDFVNRWLLHQLRTWRLNVLLLHSTFTWSRSLKIRDVWRWQRDVLYYWWRDNTVALTEGKGNRMTNTGSDRSSRLGTPQMSRAASEGHVVVRHRGNMGRLESDGALTVGG